MMASFGRHSMDGDLSVALYYERSGIDRDLAIRQSALVLEQRETATLSDLMAWDLAVKEFAARDSVPDIAKSIVSGGMQAMDAWDEWKNLGLSSETRAQLTEELERAVIERTREQLSLYTPELFNALVYSAASEVVSGAQSFPDAMADLEGHARKWFELKSRERDVLAIWGDKETWGLQSRLAERLTAAVEEREGLSFPQPRVDVHPIASEGLAMPALPTRQEAANLIGGLTASGDAIPVLARQNGSLDIGFSPHKSISVAWALGPDTEKAQMLPAHRIAADAAMRQVAAEIGFRRLGHGGSGGWHPGHIAWLSYDHFTARPTPGQPADMNVHTHYLIPNAVFCEDGSVGSIRKQLTGPLRRAEQTYQQELDRGLRLLGYETARTERGDVHLPAIPADLCQHFSKRRAQAERMSREHAAERGYDLDAMPKVRQDRRRMLVMRGASRECKMAVADFGSWRTQAISRGWTRRQLLKIDRLKELGRKLVRAGQWVDRTLGPPEIPRQRMRIGR
jgi:conjugative relaxase-like TrwC/TraI family protein